MNNSLNRLYWHVDNTLPPAVVSPLTSVGILDYVGMPVKSDVKPEVRVAFVGYFSLF